MALDPLTQTRACLATLAVAAEAALSSINADLARLSADDPQRSTLHLAKDKVLYLDDEIADLVDSFNDLEDEANPPQYRRTLTVDGVTYQINQPIGEGAPDEQG